MKVYEITFGLLNYEPSILENFKKINKVRELVEQNENVNNYLKRRPKTPF